ncbi:hypothetical protein BGZ80_008709 [Entomortierella chlamydospora]|uniref:Uncharacterized protein n=1 Tax=Entomortierella chlamydospora TaxID=101097 RepID=A0A9P6MY73_9FUNG|nr:hypothetical protein BGZ80_008709 [Entomortierella chlamydospora]
MTNARDVEPFWSLCTKLESIHMAATTIATCDSKLANLLFPNTQSLELRLLGCDGNLDQFDLIRLFPRLEELKCYSSFRDRSLGKFAQVIAQDSWPSLEKLSLGYGATDENVSPILEGVQRITSLDLSDCHFGPRSFQALQRHFSTLVELSFRECSGVQGEVFQKIMCLSPRLEILKCNKIPANDVVNGEQWVCLSLKTLQVCFRFGRGDQYLQHLVFERLATLVHLECLDIGNYSFYQENPILEPLDLRLRSGLGTLSSLTNIKFLSFYGTEQALETNEALWMLENWKNLQTVSGELNRNGTVKNTLVGILQACEVRVRE